jgi:hypothetical protein
MVPSTSYRGTHSTAAVYIVYGSYEVRSILGKYTVVLEKMDPGPRTDEQPPQPVPPVQARGWYEVVCTEYPSSSIAPPPPPQLRRCWLQPSPNYLGSGIEPQVAFVRSGWRRRSIPRLVPKCKHTKNHMYMYVGILRRPLFPAHF